MACLNQTFDATLYEDPYVLVKDGTYEAAITASEIKESRSNGQGMLELTFTILNGQYTGATLKSTFCLFYQDPKTRDFASRVFATVCRACGQMRILDSVQLHNIPLVIQVGSTNYTSRNGEIRSSKRISRYMPYPTQPPMAAPVQAITPMPAPPQAPECVDYDPAECVIPQDYDYPY